MRIKHLITLVAAGSFMAACDSTVTNVNDEAKTTGKIVIKAVDNHSGAALSEVTVYSVADDKTVITNELGLSSWDESVLGDHSFQISKEGYATIQTIITLDEQGQGDVARVGDVISTIPMFKAGVIAKGLVLYNDEKGNLNAAKNVTVYAKLPNVFVPSEMTATTSETGEYVFENLPEGVEVDIYVGQVTIDTKKYTGPDAISVSGSNYRAGDVINNGAITLSKTSAQILRVSDNIADLDTTDKLTMTFSTAIAADSVKPSKWSIENSSGSDILFTVTLSDDKRTISFAPYSGKWNSGSTYSISGTVYSVDGGSSSVNTNFSASKKASSTAPASVKGLKIEEDPDYSYYMDLTWTKSTDKNVTRYNIYRKTNLSNDYVMVDYTSSNYYRFDPDDFSSSVTEVYYVVLAVNASGIESDIADATSVKYTVED